jgi:hypothetical protein
LRALLVVVALLLLVAPTVVIFDTGQGPHDPCDSHGDRVSSQVVYLRSNPDHTLYLGDSFSVTLSITIGRNTTGYSISWIYPSVFERSGDAFTVVENETGTFTIEASVSFTGSSLSSVLRLRQPQSSNWKSLFRHN